MLPVPASTPITDMRNTSRAGAPPRLRVGSKGISLIELMIGMTIGLIALLVMMQTFSASEGQKRNTVSGADATTTGHIAIAALERDILNAGAGLTYFDCQEIRIYNPEANPQPAPYSPYAVDIRPNPATPDSLRNRSDIIRILFSTAPTGISISTITKTMPPGASVLMADNGIGFKQGDKILIYEPGKPCVVLELTARDPLLTGGQDGRWNFNVNPGTGFNPPGDGDGFIPPGGYLEGTAKIMSLGPSIAPRTYSLVHSNADASVPRSNLRYEGPASETASGATSTLLDVMANDIIALRAQYGWFDPGTNSVSFSSTVPAGVSPRNLAAVRVGIVARTSDLDRGYTAPASIRLFDGANSIEIALNESERKYRYRTFETIVPLRNTIWNR